MAIKDVAHLYLGCPIKGGIPERIDELTEGRLKVMRDNPTKLILVLRPLWDISKEEFCVWAKLCGTHFDEDMFNGFKAASKSMGTQILDFKDYRTSVISTNYFRKIGIDCDELIESGLAIDATN